MSNTKSRIQEQIEREYPVNEGGLSSMRNAALRGAEIALENQWIRVEDTEIEPVAPYWIACGYKRWIAYHKSGEWYWYHNDAIITDKVTHVIRLLAPTPPKP